MKTIARALASFLLVVAANDIFSVQTAALAQPAAPAPSTEPAMSDLPILGLAQVTFKVSDLNKSRGYYTGVLGFSEAFDLKDTSGNVTSAYFKVNDEQYIEIVPGLKPDDLVREARVVIQAADLNKLHGIYQDRGVNPGPITTGPDGNPVFRVTASNGAIIDFLQYAPGSQQSLARGKFLTNERISTHLLHAGVMLKDPALRPFFTDTLGFGRILPGTRGDYIELPASDTNLQTRNPPLDPKNPATLAQYTREVYGAVYHFSLEVPDMRAVRDLVQKRGGYNDVQVRVAMGRGQRRWLMHIYDPDGTRAEFLETPLRDLPPNTVMAPGAPAPPIMPKADGSFGWP